MTSTIPTFERPVSATERLYLATRPLAAPFAIQLVVTGSGDLALDELTAAVTRACAACPGARLRRDGDRWVDSGVPARVTVVDGGVDFDALDDDPVLTRDLGADGRATTEVVLVRGGGAALTRGGGAALTRGGGAALAPGGATTTVVFRAFHGVMDARGLWLWAADVFRVLRGQDPIGAPDPTADHDLVGRLGSPGKPTTLLPSYRSPLGASGPVPRERPFLWRHRTVPGTAAAAVARISAVLADAAGATIRIMVPVDLRRHDPALRSTANLALPLFLDVAPGESWSQVHAQILTRMAGRSELNEMDNGGLARLPASLTRAVLRGVHRLGARTNRNLVSAIVSHAGQVSTVELSAPGFTATGVRAIPVHTGLVPVSFVVLECDGTTEITVSCRSGAGVDERLTALLDAVAAELTGTGDVSEPVLTPAVPAAPAAAGTDTADERFRLHARSAPDAVAVSGPDGECTYRDLDARADAIAAALRDHGVTPGAVVAILAGRTLLGVAGQLGILRAGAAFLPLDPKHPAERLSSVVADSGATLLLAERVHAGAVPTAVPALFLDDLPETVEHPVRVPIRGDDVAFVTYTSGSTGRPKGVLVPHAGVVNFVDSATDWYRLGPQTRFAHHHTPAADMACAAFFGALLTGGAVMLVPGDTSHLSLRSMLCESGANTFLFTPSLLEVVTRLDIDPPTPRTVIIGGEQLPPALAARARRFFGADARLLNSYGPTELSIVCTTHVIEEDPDPNAVSVPIGAPAAGTDAYLLDVRRLPVPAGEIGELYFSGPQVARGYLGRPELTAERFVLLPGGVRAYRTGDLARVLPGGDLDFAGRVDEQVKVRGNRVEPGEVRAVLEGCPGVDRAAVVGRRGQHGNVLAAYVIASDGLEETAVRDFLAERLPAYMVPAVIRQVDELPLTANGKLDVSRLPDVDAPAPGGPPQQSAENEPGDERDPDLDRIAAIWVKVLSVDRAVVTPDADFFALGGDSLASLEMLSQVSRTVVGTAGEARFVARLDGLVQRMTLAHVHAAATAARDGRDPS
ncbi:non-ribosomal peptide synthetase [Rhodococcus sp. NPDC004095]